MPTTITVGGYAAFAPDDAAELCLGYARAPCTPSITETYYGWAGDGGALAVFVPSLGLSFAYVTNTAYSADFINLRPAQLLDAAVHAALAQS